MCVGSVYYHNECAVKLAAAGYLQHCQRHICFPTRWHSGALRCDTVALLSCAALHFTVPDLWRVNSPNVNPVDYKVCGMLQECLYCTPIVDVDDLKQCLIAARSGLDQHVIHEAINQWHGWLHACVKADGRHLEHLR